MKLIFSYNKHNYLFGKLRDLLDAVKSFSNIKVGLGASYYEEIIPFTNVAYTDDYVVGIQPYNTSSESLSSFKDSQSTDYRNYNVIFLIYSDMKFGVLRSGQNSEPHNSTLSKNDYKYYNWFEENLDAKFRYNSIKDKNDTEKIKKLIEGIKQGYNLKIKFSLNGVNYILTPTIEYFNFDNNPNSLSVKTHPIIDISEIEKNKRFLLKECFFNINGDVSILQSKEYFLSKSSNFFLKLVNFFFRKLKINLQLIKKNIIKNEKFLNQDIEWYLY